MSTSGHPIESIFEGVSRFYKGSVVSNALDKELYHGNLVIYGPGDLIENWTFERYPDEFRNTIEKSGEKGYDDPERLAYALRTMSLYRERRGKDRDGAIAISDKGDGYRIVRAGGYIKAPVIEDEKLNEFLSEASYYKGGEVNGRHIAGFSISRLTDGATGAVIASKGGSSIVTAVGDKLMPKYSEHIDRYMLPEELI